MSVTWNRVVLLIGVLFMVLSAFGVPPVGPFDLFQFGVALGFTSQL